MLTKRQSSLLSFIKEYQKKNGGVSPSFDEMKDAIGLKSKGNIHRILSDIEARGLISRMNHHARAIHIVGSETNNFGIDQSQNCDEAIRRLEFDIAELMRVYGRKLGHKVVINSLNKFKHNGASV